MNSSRTLAEKFREQRTDRIRVDDAEVLSMAEVIVRPTSSLELVIEGQRDDVAQVLFVRSRTQAARITHVDQEPSEHPPTELVEIHVPTVSGVELSGDESADTVFQIWNGWQIGDHNHSWLGNSGVIVEDLEAPSGANLRFRMWFSDGLGEPTFDDLVVLATVGEKLPQKGSFT